MSKENVSLMTTAVGALFGWSLRAAGNYWWEWKHLGLTCPPDEMILLGITIAVMLAVVFLGIATITRPPQ